MCTRKAVPLLVTFILALLLSVGLVSTYALAEGERIQTARPATAGQLMVTGTKLTDQNGTPVVLRGVSTHGIQWFAQFVNDELFGQLAQQWNCNLVRLALYSEDYCLGDQQEMLEVLRRGIDACISNDMYVLVDWHILNDNDPNINKEQAMAFFELISSEYAGVPKYLQILYDRVPSLPQVLTNDFGILGTLWRNIAYRVARTVR